MTIESKQTQKGFTLIELMIVVAIIGILASIAIPQFATFRIKAYNSAALSDIHGARLAEEALFTDYQSYGGSSTAITASAVTTTGALLSGATTKTPFIATKTTSTGMPITISNAVLLAAITDVAADPGNATPTYATSATITAKHTEGDKIYAAETDQSGLYQKPSAAKTKLTLATSVASTVKAGVFVADAAAAKYLVMK